MQNSIRDIVTGEVTLDYFANRIAQGWKLGSIEWIRESDEADASQTPERAFNVPTDLPFGLQLTGNGTIQENSMEATVLFHILDQVIKEKSVLHIAADLNAKGYSTRQGTPWTASSVFELLPRLIEAGPSLAKSDAWRQRQVSQPPVRESLH